MPDSPDNFDSPIKPESGPPKMTRAAWEAREFVAKFYAMPLREIREVRPRKRGSATRTVVLECGHRGVLYLWLRVGETVRCRECYDGGLQEAERMIERIGI